MTTLRFAYEGTKYEIDPERMTFAEARAFEKASGRTMQEMAKSDAQDVSTIQAFFWLAMRRQEPTMRFSDLDDMNMGDFEDLTEETENEQAPPDPTPPPPSLDETETG